MASFKIPLHNPLKFRKVTDKAFHFDEGWSFQQVRPYEMKLSYRQKWKQNKITKLQCEGSFGPQPLEIYDKNTLQLLKTIAWSVAYNGISYKVYELDFDVSTIAIGTVIVAYQKASFMAFDWRSITEPIEIVPDNSDLVEIVYKNSYNDWGVAFSTGIEFLFMVEGDLILPDFKPARDRNVMKNQDTDIVQLYGKAYRVIPFCVGPKTGIPPWVLDLMDRIFLCDFIQINEKLYQSDDGSNWEKTYVKGNPFVFDAKIDVLAALTEDVLEFKDDSLEVPGFVTGYNIETGFFSPPVSVTIEKVEINE